MPAQNHKRIYYLVSLLVGISLLLAACSTPVPSPSPTTMAEPPATAAPVTILEPITQADLVGRNLAVGWRARIAYCRHP